MNYEIIELPRIIDPRGNLSVAEETRNIPFDIKRVYFVYDVPAGESRGGHAHKECKEFIIAVSGSFTLNLEANGEKVSLLLNKPYQGVLVNEGIWRTLDDFSSGAVVLVLASDFFDEDDYIRDYDEFINSEFGKPIRL